MINVSAGDVEWHSRFWILPPSPAISDAEEINAKVTFYEGKWKVSSKMLVVDVDGDLRTLRNDDHSRGSF